jgi:hypothetical protein
LGEARLLVEANAVGQATVSASVTCGLSIGEAAIDVIQSEWHVPLKAGWNWVGYAMGEVKYRADSYPAGHPDVPFAIPPDPSVFTPVDSISDILTSIDGLYTVVRSFDINGGHTYDPEVPDFINNLDYMGPGYGYQIKMSANGILDWSASGLASRMASTPGMKHESQRIHFEAASNESHFTPVAKTGTWLDLWGTFKIDCVDAEAGDEVGVFVDDDCFGSSTVNVPGWYGFLPVYGDDPTTVEKDGASLGDVLTLRIWDSSVGVEHVLTIDDYSGPDHLTWQDGMKVQMDIVVSSWECGCSNPGCVLDGNDNNDDHDNTGSGTGSDNDSHAEPECVDDRDCNNDGLFCNGDEICVDDNCEHSGNPCDEDETCDEYNDMCTPPEPVPECETDTDCDDGIFCNGEEECIDDSCFSGDEPCDFGQICMEDQVECLDVVTISTSTSRFTTEIQRPILPKKRCRWIILIGEEKSHFDSKQSTISFEGPDRDSDGVGLSANNSARILGRLIFIPLCVEKDATPGQWAITIETEIEEADTTLFQERIEAVIEIK